jgi:4-amino-4-deoxy-L-arabinose transferase-like glycosyltransferase
MRSTITLLVLGLAVGLRLAELTHFPGLGGDEAWIAYQVRSWLHGGAHTWITPSQRWLSPLFILSSVPFQALLSPSTLAVRLPAVMSNLLLLPLSYWLAKEVRGKAAGFALVVLLATLPISIAYSRIGWEACHFLLITLLPLYFAFRGKPAAWVLSLLLAVSVHALAVFVIPLCLGPLWFARPERRVRPGHLAAAIAGLAVVTGLALLTFSGSLHTYYDLLAGVAGERHYGLTEIKAFVVGFAQLLSGTSGYREFIGEPSGRWFSVLDGFAGLVGLTAILAAIGWWWRQRAWAELSCAVGLGISLVIFFLIAGPAALVPGSERYALIFVAPVAWLGAIFLGRVMSEVYAERIALTLGVAGLSSFLVFYFGVIPADRPPVHPVYAVADTDPKEAALGIILADATQSASAPGPIVTEDWWLMWAMRYLAFNAGPISIQEMAHAGPVGMMMEQGAYFVGYPRGSLRRHLVAASQGQNWKLASRDLASAGGSPVLEVWRAMRSGDMPPPSNTQHR